MAVGPLTGVQAATLALAAGSAALGLTIAYYAYRGLRRYDSRQMLYLATGLLLLFGLAYALAMLGSVLVQFRYVPLYWQDYLRLVVRLVQFVGLGFIAYSLRVDDGPGQ